MSTVYDSNENVYSPLPSLAFQSTNFDVVDYKGQPWLQARQIGQALGYSRPDAVLAIYERNKDEFSVDMTTTIELMVGVTPQLTRIFSLRGCHLLAMFSRTPVAKIFRAWVLDVLGSVQKYGAYLTPTKIEEVLADPDTIISLATTLKNERQKRETLEQQAVLDAPRVFFSKAVEGAKTSILVGDLAKIIHQSTGYPIGQNRLFEFLRENGYLHKGGSQKNTPTQRSIEAGWMEIKEGTRTNASGETVITKTTKITGKGQIYFVGLFQKMVGEECDHD